MLIMGRWMRLTRLKLRKRTRTSRILARKLALMIRIMITIGRIQPKYPSNIRLKSKNSTRLKLSPQMWLQIKKLRKSRSITYLGIVCLICRESKELNRTIKCIHLHLCHHLQQKMIEIRLKRLLMSLRTLWHQTNHQNK